MDFVPLLERSKTLFMCGEILGLHDEIPNIPKPYKLHHADGSSFLTLKVVQQSFCRFGRSMYITTKMATSALFWNCPGSRCYRVANSPG